MPGRCHKKSKYKSATWYVDHKIHYWDSIAFCMDVWLCAEWLIHILCLSINNINSYHHLACHNAFTEAKNHKHIYTLINILKNMAEQWVFLFSWDMGAKHVNTTWTWFMDWEAPPQHLSCYTSLNWLKRLVKITFSAMLLMRCPAQQLVMCSKKDC